MSSNQTISHPYYTELDIKRFGDLIAQLVRNGLTFEASTDPVKGEARIVLTGGF